MEHLQARDDVLDEICALEQEAAAIEGEASAVSGRLETKAANDRKQSAWQRYMQVNDRRLEEIASRGVADPLLAAELARLDVMQELKAGHRQNAGWLMTRGTVGQVRKFKDSTGQYLWQPSLIAGQPPTFMSYPIDEDEFMPDIGADTFAIGFGDWKKTYIIVDRVGVRVLRNPYRTPGFVEFYTTKRVGGGVQNFDAAIFLKFGVS